MTVRQATHAGSWYTDDREQLDYELQQWLDNVPEEVTEVTPVGDSCPVPVKGIRAIIGPHAGFSYSGANAAYGYKCIDTQNIKRVFLLGPSHHAYLKTCALSQCTEYSTPLGNIRVDQELVQELQDKGEWRLMSTRVDQDEHSLEMHLPYIYKVFESRIEQISLVPIMVGSLAFETEQKYGKLLAPYLADPENLFIISSDFCHWGSRFGYTYYQSSEDNQPCDLSARDGRPNGVPIWESIQRLDSEGMDVITQLDHVMFREYLDDTSNTICGNHPISVLLAAVNHMYPKDAQNRDGPRLRFVKYDQSSKVCSAKDSSMAKGSVAVTPQSPTTKVDEIAPVSKSTAHEGADALTPSERETMVNEAEWGFRNWLRDAGPRMGYVMYPSSQQILKSLQALYKTIDDIDFSDIAR
ncbi:hypothetical protein LPJ62_003371 [Coemansia sp. RSA 2167]|nr:hypothetical protein LPJ62_003371 [Coemansia sp. RSA 2167]